MHFDWEPDKARTNLVKHRTSFELARCVWDDPLRVVVPDWIEGGERQWHAIGLVGPVVIIVVVCA